MLNHLFRLLLAEVFPVLGDVILHLPQTTDYQSPENACKDAIFLSIAVLIFNSLCRLVTKNEFWLSNDLAIALYASFYVILYVLDNFL